MSWSKKRRSPGCASSKVATRTAGSAIASASAARATRGSSPAGRRTRVRYRTRLPSRTRPVASRLARAQEHARPEREERRRAIRLLSEDAGHGEARVADGERVAEREPEPRRGRPPRPRRRRRRAARRAAARAGSRAARRADSRSRPPSARRGACSPCAGFRAIATSSRTRVTAAPRRARSRTGASAAASSGRARAKLDVAAEQGPRLAAERAVERGGHAQDGDEGSDAERDARQEPDEVSPGAAGLTPGETGDETPGQRGRRRRVGRARSPHAAARSPTTRPSRSSTIRWAWAARAGS